MRGDRLNRGDPTSAVGVLERALDPVRLLTLLFLIALLTTRFGAGDQTVGDDVRWGLVGISVIYIIAIVVRLRGEENSIVDRLLHPLIRVVLDTLVALMVLLLVDTAAGPLAWLVLAMPMLTANIHYGSFAAVIAWLAMSLAYLGLSIISADSESAANDALGAGIQQLFALLIIASGVGVVIKSVRDRVEGTDHALREARSRSRQLSGIANSAQTMADIDEPLAVLSHAVAQIPTFGFTDAEIVERFGPGDYRVVAAVHVGDRRLPSPETLTDKAIETGALVQVQLGQSLVTDQVLHLHDYRSGAALPVYEDVTRSLVVRGWLDSSRDALQTTDIRSFELYATQVTTAYANALEVQRLEERSRDLAWEADHDALTGLANRAQLMRILHERLAPTNSAAPAPVALMFLDLDGFKAANDTHGHLVGDQVLVEIAHRLMRLVDRPHVLGRLGGDEFLLIADSSTDVDIGIFANRIVAAVSQPLRIGEAVIHLSTSVGVAQAGLGTTPDEILQQADQAMYTAKQEGGSRVSHYRRTPTVRTYL
ncbi:MAG: GGDEF domain-containing protein [Acidimicrobiales bacterium]|nr:GGDEF domain-containing protein [Acidimicrobiales bacterium]